MDWLAEILKPPILPAIFVAAGFILLKKPLSEILSGAVKTMIGFMILVFGVQIAIQVISPLNDLILKGFGAHSVLLNSEMMGANLLVNYGMEGFCVMFIAIAVNLLLARFSKFKSVYLTGHHLLYYSLLVAVLLGTMTPLPPWAVILTGGCFVGIYACLTVKVTQPFLKQVTGNNMIGFANSGNTGAIIGGLLGRLFKGGSRYEASDKNWFEVKDVVVLSTVVMFFYYIVFHAITGDVKDHWILDCILNSAGFGAAISVVFLGMRMLLAEIIQIIYTLHTKFVPNAAKGLDSSAVIAYSPSAWMAGFLISFAVGIAVMFVMLVTGFKYVAIPGVASCFFAGGSAAVFANAYGGKRGAVIASAVVGALISLSVVWLLSSAPRFGDSGITFGETEYGIWGGALAWLLKVFSGI